MWGWESHGGWWLMPFAFMAVICIGMMWRGKMGRMPMRSGHDQQHGETETTVEIVKRRYAKGEIDKEEYNHLVRKLTE